MRKKMVDQFFFNMQTTVLESWVRDINRQLVFFCKRGNPFYMVDMLMTNKDRFYFFHGKIKPLHSFLNFTAGDPCIHKNGFGFISQVIAVSVAARIQGSDI